MKDVKVKILKPGAKMPVYGTEFSAGADLCACLEQAVTLEPGETRLISIGISIADCGDLLLQHRCMQALNVDGGTSAMIWYDGAYIMESSNPVMTKGRLLPNAFVYQRAG